MKIQTGVQKTAAALTANFEFVIDIVESQSPNYIISGSKNNKKYIVNLTENDLIDLLQAQVEASVIRNQLGNTQAFTALANKSLKGKEFLFQVKNFIDLSASEKFSTGTYISGSELTTNDFNSEDDFEPVLEPQAFRPFPVPYLGSYPRLGYTNLPVPISAIQYSRQSDYEEIPILRSQGTVKKGTGYSYETYNLTYVVDGPDEIKSGVIDVLNLVNLTPFISVEGAPFKNNGNSPVLIPNNNPEIPYSALAVKNYSITTSPMMPNQLIVTLAVDPFNYQFYVPPFYNTSETLPKGGKSWYHEKPRNDFDDMICWPLVKLWATSRAKQVPQSTFNGILSMYFLTTKGEAELKLAVDNSNTQDEKFLDENTLTTLGALIAKKGPSSITSANAAEIRSTSSATRTFITKINNRNTWNTLLTNARSYVVGLVEWQKIENNSSLNAANNNTITIGKSQNNNQASATNFNKPSNSVPAIVDVILTGTLASNIETYYKSKFSIVGTPVVNDANYEIWINTVKPLIESAQKNPHEYFALCFVTKNNREEVTLQTTVETSRKRVAPQLFNSTLSGVVREDVLSDATNKEIIINTLDNDKIIIEQISATKGFNLALKTTQIDPLPLHEYLGGNDTTFVLQGKCFGPDGVSLIKNIKAQYDSRAVQKTSEKFATNDKHFNRYSSFLGVDNELFAILGIDFIIPLDIQIVSIEGEPNVWSFSLTCVEHNLNTLQQEKIKFLDTEASNLARILNFDANGKDRSTVNPTVAAAVEYISLNSRLSKEEVYQDMQLPTYLELRNWINALKKVADAWKELLNNKKNKDLPISYVALSNKNTSLTTKYRLDTFELSVARVCEEFFAYDYKAFLEWNDATIPKHVQADAFVDPDFYCYYEYHDDWKKLIDDLAEREYGPRDGIAATDKGQSKAELKRFTDTAHDDATYVYSQEANKNIIKNLEPTIQSIRDTQLKGQTGFKKYQAAEAKLDEKAGQKAWWGGNSSFVKEKSFGKTTLDVVVMSEDEKIKYLTENPSINQPAPSETSDPESRGRTNPFTGSENRELKFSREFLLELEKVDYRLKLLTEFQGVGFNLLSQPFDLGLAGTPSENSDRRFLPSTEDIEALRKYDFTGLQAFTLDRNSKEFGLFDYKVLLTKLETPIDKFDYGYLRTIKLNSNFAAIISGKVKPDFDFNPTLGDTNYKLASMENFFAYYGKVYGIDPTIVKAVLLRREGVGSVNTSSIPAYLFKTYKSAFGTELKSGLYKDRIDVVSRLYSDGIKRYAIPSLALIYVHAHLDDELSKKYVTNEGVFSDNLNIKLTQLKNKYISSKFGTKAIELSRDIKNLGDLGTALNEYWTAYIEISRIFGSYIKPANFDNFKVDAYFNNKHPLIVIDVANNISKSFDFPGPSGNTTGLDLNRTNTEHQSFDNRTFRNLKDENLTSQFTQSAKFRTAQQPEFEGAIYGFISDMRNYGVYGRLLAAFPTVQAIIINEGFFYVGGSQKLWDQYYTRSGIVDVEIFKSRNHAADTCSITYSNMFHYLSAYALEEAHAESLARAAKNRVYSDLSNRDGTWSAIQNLMNEAVFKNLPPDLKQLWQNNRLKQLALHPGARLQVRLGYGSRADKLPVVFNGTVVSCPLQDGYMTLTAVGDGLELERQVTRSLVPVDNGFSYQDSGAFGIGKDPSSIVTEALVGGSILANLTGGRFGKDDNGIAHFGNIVYGPGGAHKPYETQINIYSSSPTKVEQGLSYLKNYFNVNALYNFDNENNFSISVKEPTVWKIAHVCANACMDFVTRAEPFANRSTLFFGKWWYPYHYDYKPSIVNLLTDTSLLTARGNIITESSQYRYKNTEPRRPEFTESPLKRTGPDTRNIGFGSQNEGTAALPSEFRITVQQNIKNVNPEVLKLPLLFNAIVSNSNPEYIISAITIPSGKTPGATTTVDYLKNNRELTRVVYTYTGLHWAPSSILRNTSRSFQTDVSLTNRGDITRESASLNNGTNQPINESELEEIKASSIDGFDTNQLDLIADVDDLTKHLKYKNYMQAYIVSSHMNLLENRMSLNSETFATDAVGVHLENGIIKADAINKTMTFKMDNNIISSDRKMSTIDTGLLLTNFQKGPGRVVAQSLGGLFTWVPGVSEFINEKPSTPAINNSVVTGLVKMARDMYDGEIISMFQPTMKPGDLVEFNDIKSSLKGPLFVKEVVHKLSVRSGSITVIVPDLVSLPASSVIGLHCLQNLSMGIMQKANQYLAYKTMSVMWKFMTGYSNKRQALNLAKDTYSYNLMEDAFSKEISNFNSNTFTTETIDKINKQLTDQVDTLKKRAEKVTGEAKQAIDKEIIGVYKELFINFDFEKEANVIPTNTADALKSFNHGVGRINSNDIYRLKNLLETPTVLTLDDIEFLKKVGKIELDRNPERLKKLFTRVDKVLRAAGLVGIDKTTLTVLEGTNPLISEIIKFRQDLTNEVAADMKIIKEGGKPVGITGRSKLDLITALEQRTNKRKAAFYLRIKNNKDLWDAIPLNLRIQFDTTQQSLTLFERIFSPGKFLNSQKYGKKFTHMQYLKNRQNLFFGTDNGDIFRNADAIAEFPEAHVDEYIKAEQMFADLDKILDEESFALKGVNKINTRISEAFDAQNKQKILDFINESDNKAFAYIKKAQGKGGIAAKQIDKTINKIVHYSNIQDRMDDLIKHKKMIRLMLNCGPQVVFSIAREVIMATVGNEIILGVNARLAAMHSVILVPLMSTKSRIPYVAGIRGHQGAVIGDTPGWADNLISGLLTGKDGGIGSATSFLAAFAGVEQPQWMTLNNRDKKLMLDFYGDTFNTGEH